VYAIDGVDQVDRVDAVDGVEAALALERLSTRSTVSIPSIPSTGAPGGAIRRPRPAAATRQWSSAFFWRPDRLDAKIHRCFPILYCGQ
jgi:hypothetical protein